MKYLPILAAIAALLAFNPTSTNAEIDKKLQKANWANVLRLIKDVEAVDETVEAVKSMDGLLDHEMALELLKYFEQCDMAWDAAVGDKGAPKEASGRPKQAYKIANAIIACIRKMNEAEEVVKFAETVNDKEEYGLRPRMAMVDAIAQCASHEGCMAVLMELAKNEKKDKDTDMRIIAVQHLGAHAANTDVLNVVLACLRDPSWRVRDAAVQAAVKAASQHEEAVLLALINLLDTESGKMSKIVADALYRITREDLGTDPDAWVEWFTNKKRAAEGLPPKSGKGNRGTRVKVFETDSFSDRYVFVIDTSISMTEKITEEEKEKLKKSVTSEPGQEKDPRRPLDWSQINCKLDLAREEMIRSLEVMDPEKTTFTIITFAENVIVWKEELIPTSEDNVQAAADMLRAIKGAKRTNVFGAMDAAYDLSETLAGVDVDKRKPKKPKKGEKGPVTGKHPDDALPDTIFLYTDGYATWGKYSGDDQGWAGKSNEEKAKLYAPIMKDMVAEIGDRNRIARITVNCIGVGVRQDNTTLSALAKACDGKYVPIGR
jgi:hypothetical protein